MRIRHGHFYGLQNDFRARWYVDPAKSGGGALLDEGVHGADWLAWTFGMPKNVIATMSHAALGLPVEDLGIATYGWTNGMLAELTASFTFAAADASIELYGTQGTILVSGIDLASRDITHEGFVRRYRSDQPARQWETVALTPRFKLGQFHQQNALAFLDALERGAPPPITVHDGERAVRMIAAAYEAARSGHRPGDRSMNGPPRPSPRRRTMLRHEGAYIPVYVARPASPPSLTVLMFGAIWSVTPHIEDLCDRLASAGFGAVAPCLFRDSGIPSRAAPPETLAQTFLDFDDVRCLRDLRAAASGGAPW